MCETCSIRAENIRKYNLYNPALRAIGDLLDGAEAAWEPGDDEAQKDINAMHRTVKVIERQLYGPL